MVCRKRALRKTFAGKYYNANAVCKALIYKIFGYFFCSANTVGRKVLRCHAAANVDAQYNVNAFAINLLLITALAEKSGQIIFTSMISQFWSLPKHAAAPYAHSSFP